MTGWQMCAQELRELGKLHPNQLCQVQEASGAAEHLAEDCTGSPGKG